jgi:hypothetical protein
MRELEVVVSIFVGFSVLCLPCLRCLAGGFQWWPLHGVLWLHLRVEFLQLSQRLLAGGRRL